MELLQLERIQCPYCGEAIELNIDCSIEEQEYIEDCQVCCRPIIVSTYVDDTSGVMVSVRRDDD